MKTTLIGSMPYTDVNIAVEKIFSSVTIPCWPQMPKLSFKQQMCPQYSEQFPGIILDEDQKKIYVDEEKLYDEIEKFYQNYIDRNIEYFMLTEPYAVGFYKFLDFLKLKQHHQFQMLKLQTTGVLTFAFSVKTQNGQPLFYNEQYREIVLKHLVMKSLWQLKYVSETLNSEKKHNVILFYDEPYLAAYGSAFTATSKEEIINCLSALVVETKQMASQLYNNISLKIGIHCCANTDWSILTSVKELDIISFDAYEYFETFLLYKEDIKQFINRGGTLAWGIIPNNEKVFDTDYSNLAFCFLPKEKQELVEKIKQFSSVIFKSILNSSTEKCSIINVVLNTGIVTPQCGLGTTSIDVAEKVLEVCRKYSDMVV